MCIPDKCPSAAHGFRYLSLDPSLVLVVLINYTGAKYAVKTGEKIQHNQNIFQYYS